MLEMIAISLLELKTTPLLYLGVEFRIKVECNLMLITIFSCWNKKNLWTRFKYLNLKLTYWQFWARNRLFPESSLKLRMHFWWNRSVMYSCFVFLPLAHYPWSSFQTFSAFFTSPYPLLKKNWGIQWELLPELTGFLQPSASFLPSQWENIFSFYQLTPCLIFLFVPT